MTNLQWIVKQNLIDVVRDALDTAETIAAGATLDQYEYWKLEAYIWLFSERKEEEECITSKKSEQEQTKN